MKFRHPFALLLILLASCQHSENRYARRVVEPSEVVGTWQATDFSLSCLARIPNQGHLTKPENEIVLRPDGSCYAKGYLNPIAEARHAKKFDPREFLDDYSERLEKLVAAKERKKKDMVLAPEEPDDGDEGGEVVDLLAILSRNLGGGAKRARKGPARKARVAASKKK